MEIPYSAWRNATEMTDSINSVRSWQEDMKVEESRILEGLSKKEASEGENRNKDKAIDLKNKANKLYQDEKYKDAVAIYTQAIGLDPSNHIVFANRAMAYLKLEEFEAASRDCTKCISLDSLYLKAYLRRGAAKAKLLEISEAIKDYESVLQLEPANSEARSGIAALRMDHPLAHATTDRQVPRGQSDYQVQNVVKTTNRSLMEPAISAGKSKYAFIRNISSLNSIMHQRRPRNNNMRDRYRRRYSRLEIPKEVLWTDDYANQPIDLRTIANYKKRPRKLLTTTNEIVDDRITFQFDGSSNTYYAVKASEHVQPPSLRVSQVIASYRYDSDE